jgi:hypothetical protein
MDSSEALLPMASDLLCCVSSTDCQDAMANVHSLDGTPLSYALAIGGVRPSSQTGPDSVGAVPNAK